VQRQQRKNFTGNSLLFSENMKKYLPELVEYYEKTIGKDPTLLSEVKEFVKWCEEGALTSSDRDMFINRFKRFLS
jgi:hypothetical protein